MSRLRPDRPLSPRSPAAFAQRARRALPEGRLLDHATWTQRHRWVTALVWAHAAGLAVLGSLRGLGLLASILAASPIVVLAAVAGVPRGARRLRSGAAALGLLASSGLLVHLSGGQTEASFHLFVVLAVLTVYQDWLPFGLAVAFVFVHYGIAGALAPHAVYRDPEAWAHPVRWALIHTAFVSACSLANLLAWRVSDHLHRDGLSGLATRAVFVDRLAGELVRARRSRVAPAVLVLDLDRFKVVNDSLGHAAGDRLLVEIGRRLQAALGPDDLAARFAGDEFALLCPGTATEDAAVVKAERVGEILGEPLLTDDRDLRPAVSVGVVLAEPASTPDEVLRDAASALSAAKRQGGGRCAVFDAALRAAALERLELESALRQAVARRELRVHYQLEADLRRGHVVGLEALVRWEHPQRGLLGPDRFIAVAEETGLVVELGAWVLEEALRQSQGWRLRGHPAGSHVMRVNISARQFAQPDLAERVRDALARTDTPPSQLSLEITESVIMGDTEQTLRVLRDLRALGVSVAIDDFGTGYSSLSYLRRFPVDTLKVDRSFVSGLGEDADASAIVAAIISMAHAMRLAVVAEGVETPGHVSELRRLGCDTAQGYWLARPYAPEVVEAILATPPRWYGLENEQLGGEPVEVTA